MALLAQIAIRLSFEPIRDGPREAGMTFHDLSLKVPDSALCRAAAAHVERVHPAFLVNHVRRSFLFADAVGRTTGRQYSTELLFLACVLHDLGLSVQAPGETRFEVEGADAALDLLDGWGLEAQDREVIWDAIALHTTPVIPQRKRAEIALCQLGTAIDVGFAPVTLIGEAELAEIVSAFPRLGFKNAMADALCGLVRRGGSGCVLSPTVAEASERMLPGFVRPHICDALMSSSFEE